MTLGELKRVAADHDVHLRFTKFGGFPHLTDGGVKIPFPWTLSDENEVPGEYVLYVVESFGLEGVDIDAYLI